MNDSELLDWLTLFHAENITVALLRKLMLNRDFPVKGDTFSECSSTNLEDAASRISVAMRSAEARWLAEASIAWSRLSDNTIITLRDSTYPPLLREIADPPPLLFVRGNARALSIPQIAIVGSRRCSVDGREITDLFATGIVGQGLGVCSGLATGIDTAAHKAAVDSGGITVSVVGTGVDHIYPRSNAHLASRILENGALVSEFPLGYRPLPANFPRRNRIISGLSIGVLVVEAALQSGSLITARMAMEQNREVFAVPGSIRNALSRGCHKLIREGATLAETPQDLWNQLDGLLTLALEPGAPDLKNSRSTVNAKVPGIAPTVNQQKIIAAMGFDPISFDSIAARTNLSVFDLQTELLSLELAGAITVVSGRYTLLRQAPLQGY
jgi:DNA processing protein